ncbi:cell wall protein RBR3-like, partial [Astyanax mexicanus]
MTWRCQRLCVLSFAIFAFTGADGYVVRTKDTAQAGLVYSEDWVPLPPSEDTTTETKPSGNPSGSSAPRPQLLGSSNGIVASQNAVRLQDSLDSLQSAPSAQGLSGPYTPTSQQQDIFWTGPSSGSQAIALPSQPQRSPEPLVYASQARPLSSSQPQLLGGSLTSPSQGAPLQQLRARLLTGQGASVTLNNVRPVSDLAQQSGSPYMSMPSQASSTGPTYSSFQPGFQSALSQFPSAPTGQYRAPSSSLRPGSDFAQQSSSQSGFQPVSTGQTSSSFQTGFLGAPSQFPSALIGQYTAPSQGAPSSSLRPASDFAQQPSQYVGTSQTTSSFLPGFQTAPSQFPSASIGQYTAPSQGAPSSSLRPASDFAQQPSQYV